MALASPRFRNCAQLQTAAAGSTLIQQGARGRHVHLVQMALLDLGYSMPRSTVSDSYSPDGIFGQETNAVVRKFQQDSGLKADGKIGPKTMGELDRRHADYKHHVRLHFRSLSLTSIPEHRLISNTEIVYAQYGIEVQFGSGMSLFLSKEEEKKFAKVDGQCNWVISTGEMNELHAMGGLVAADEIKVFYVTQFADANLLGCGGHAPNRPACTVAAAGGEWDTAHEVGHVLLTSGFTPVHIGDKRNLMFPTSHNEKDIPALTDKQLRQIRASVCCKAT